MRPGPRRIHVQAGCRVIRNILVVCTGNICRSPVAAALLRERLPGREISSAGLSARVREPVHPLAAKLAAEEELDVDGHRARQLTDRMLSEAELVLVMTSAQRRSMLDRAPLLGGRIMLFGRWLDAGPGGASGAEIPDPYRKDESVFRRVHRLMVRAADAWREQIA